MQISANPGRRGVRNLPYSLATLQIRFYCKSGSGNYWFFLSYLYPSLLPKLSLMFQGSIEMFLVELIEGHTFAGFKQVHQAL